MPDSAPLPHGAHTGKLLASYTTQNAIVTEYGYASGLHVEPHAHAAPFIHLVRAQRPVTWGREPVHKALDYVGTVSFSPAGDEHGVDIVTETLNIAIDLLPSFEQRLGDDGADLMRPLGRFDPYAYQLARQIWDEVQDADPLSGLEIDALINGLCESLLVKPQRRVATQGSPYWLRRIIKEIDDRYTENFSLDELATHVHMHPSNLSRAFHRYSGETLRDYVRRLRIRDARRLLKAGSLSLAEIAVEVGYWDESHLLKAFKKVVGMTPGRYRRLVRGATTMYYRKAH
jgi:AraC-like DNA-binding protein